MMRKMNNVGDLPIISQVSSNPALVTLPSDVKSRYAIFPLVSTGLTSIFPVKLPSTCDVRLSPSLKMIHEYK